MKKSLSLILLTFVLLNAYSQKPSNVFMNYSEFKADTPAKSVDFEIVQRSQADIFMSGGILNYKIQKVKPSSEKEKFRQNVWGVIYQDTVFINSYPFSKRHGFNKILEKGYYTYFIGEPAFLRAEQLKLGIIKNGEAVKSVCCQTAYVILPDGTVKWLNPEILKQLVSDHTQLSQELENKKFAPEDVYEMFGVLSQYNLSKSDNLKTDE